MIFITNPDSISSTIPKVFILISIEEAVHAFSLEFMLNRKNAPFVCHSVSVSASPPGESNKPSLLVVVEQLPAPEIIEALKEYKGYPVQFIEGEGIVPQ